MPGSSCAFCGWSNMERAVETCPECGFKVTPWGQEENTPAAAEVFVPKVGMRVYVLSRGQEENWGLATIIWLEAGGYPSEIQLDMGRVVEGSECRWYPITQELILDLVKRSAAKRRKVSPARMGDHYLCDNPAVVFRRVTEDAFGATNVMVRIDEPLTVSELAGMIWQYVA